MKDAQLAMLSRYEDGRAQMMTQLQSCVAPLVAAAEAARQASQAQTQELQVCCLPDLLAFNAEGNVLLQQSMTRTA